MSSGSRPTFWRGFGLGALVGILSHPLAWFLFSIILYASGALGARNAGPIQALRDILSFSVLSLLLVGWITAPLGGAVGGYLGFLAGQERDKSSGLR
jgi:fumarate reductase subunit D